MRKHLEQGSRKIAFALAAAVSALIVTAAPAHANIIFYSNPGDFQSALNVHGIVSANVLYNDLSLTLTGNPVQGKTQGNLVVSFSTTGDLLEASGGQARIEAADDLFDDLTINPLNPNVYFRSLSLKLNPNAAGNVSFAVLDQFGATAQVVLTVNTSGLTFLGIISTNGQLMDSVAFTSQAQITDVRHVRIGGAQSLSGVPFAVPEPASMLLLGAGLGGLVLNRRRRV